MSWNFLHISTNKNFFLCFLFRKKLFSHCLVLFLWWNRFFLSFACLVYRGVIILALVYLLHAVYFFFIDCPRTNVRVSSVIDAFRYGAGGMEAGWTSITERTNHDTIGSVCVWKPYGVDVRCASTTYSRNSIPEKKNRINNSEYKVCCSASITLPTRLYF